MFPGAVKSMNRGRTKGDRTSPHSAAAIPETSQVREASMRLQQDAERPDGQSYLIYVNASSGQSGKLRFETTSVS